MRIAVVTFACLLLGLPATAAEVIRYRTPDGSVGFVDDEKRLPPGVEVLSRTPLEPSAPRPAPPASERETRAAPSVASVTPSPVATPLASEEESGADCDALADRLARARCSAAREARCSHYGLRPGCAAGEIAAAEGWCTRSSALREEIAGVDEARDAARARYDACMGRRSFTPPDCASEELEEAEHAARASALRVEALEEQCHDEGCLPGWVREGCAFPEA
jgi:hypothetical protein